MSLMLAFDVYGTLIDTHGVLSKLQEFVGDKAKPFSNTWREKQLEYSFRRGLMKHYQNFAVCTAQALEYTAALYGIKLSDEQKSELLQSYRELPAFSDVTDALTQLKAGSSRLYAFSNGSAEAVETLLINADIRNFFDGIVSVDELQSFKPDPAVYKHLLNKTKSPTSRAWLISSNPFDVIGASAVGMKTAWVQRSPESVFDPWGVTPTTTIRSLGQLSEKINSTI